MREDRQALCQRALVVEFLGLPGAGKSTVAACLAAELRAQGIEVRTTDDFVAWLARQSRFTKVSILGRDLPSAWRQLWRGLMFGLSLRPTAGFSISRIALVPFINCCFERYLRLHREAVVVMDQANMQLVWSVGAYAAHYGEQPLNNFSRVAQGAALRIFAFVSASANVSAERIRLRASTSSRFDRESAAGLKGALHASAKLMTDIANRLVQDGERLIALDATVPVEFNSRQLFVAVRDELSKRPAPAG